LLVDAVDHLLDPVDIGEPEGLAVGASHGKCPSLAHPAHRGASPPLLQREALGRLPVPHLIPMQVSALVVDWAAFGEDFEQAQGVVVGNLRQQLGHIRRRQRPLHGVALRIRTLGYY